MCANSKYKFDELNTEKISNDLKLLIGSVGIQGASQLTRVTFSV